jgi:hypothetical protein
MSDPPSLQDFMSHRALGREMRVSDPTPEIVAMWSGISVFATEGQALAKLRRFPSLGKFIVAIEVDDQVIAFRPTGRDRGHHTIWGDPEVIMEGVKWVKALSEPELSPGSAETGANDVL